MFSGWFLPFYFFGLFPDTAFVLDRPLRSVFGGRFPTEEYPILAFWAARVMLFAVGISIAGLLTRLLDKPQRPRKQYFLAALVSAIWVMMIVPLGLAGIWLLPKLEGISAAFVGSDFVSFIVAMIVLTMAVVVASLIGRRFGFKN